jgi:hypothetical protein
VNPLTWRRFLIALFLAVGIWYVSWGRGTVFARRDAGGVTLRIRQIPVRAPGFNSEFAYRCEIWRKGVLFKATTQIADGFIANRERCSIEVVSSKRAVFHLDGYRITCDEFVPYGDTPAETTWSREPK